MKRRNFLSLMGAASLAPALPALGAPAPLAAGYNRYMYGLGVFEARTRAGLTVADLMTRLRISALQAEAMMGEMTARGVFTSLSGSAAGGALQRPHAQTYVRKALRKMADTALADDTGAIPAPCPDSEPDR